MRNPWDPPDPEAQEAPMEGAWGTGGQKREAAAKSTGVGKMFGTLHCNTSGESEYKLIILWGKESHDPFTTIFWLMVFKMFQDVSSNHVFVAVIIPGWESIMHREHQW